MAEGFARHLGMGRIEAFSAGIAPAPLDPKAVQIMAELNIDIANHIGKGLQDIVVEDMNLVVTLCDYARACAPLRQPAQHCLHWSIADPTGMWGPDWFVLRAYRKVRDDLEARIRNLLTAILR
jgi:arsenate reductase